MAPITVHFEYRTGLLNNPVHNVRLTGNWDQGGKLADAWRQIPMRKAEDAFVRDTYTADVQFSDSEIEKSFSWGVVADTPAGLDHWRIMAETGEGDAILHRDFVLQTEEPGTVRTERYWVTPQYSLGANKYKFGATGTRSSFSSRLPIPSTLRLSRPRRKAVVISATTALASSRRTR